MTNEGSIFDCIQPLITPNKEPTIRSVNLRGSGGGSVGSAVASDT